MTGGPRMGRWAWLGELLVWALVVLALGADVAEVSL